MRHLSADGLADFFVQHPNAKVLDVRFAYERESGYLPGAFQVPWYTPDWEHNPDFMTEVLRLLSPDDPVLVICRNGQRSCEAAVLLEKAGFRHVYNVLGGYEDIAGSPRSCWLASMIRGTRTGGYVPGQAGK